MKVDFDELTLRESPDAVKLVTLYVDISGKLVQPPRARRAAHPVHKKRPAR